MINPTLLGTAGTQNPGFGYPFRHYLSTTFERKITAISNIYEPPPPRLDIIFERQTQRKTPQLLPLPLFRRL